MSVLASKTSSSQHRRWPDVHLRSILGKSELDELLSEREKINQILQEDIDKNTEPWGVKVSNVEINM